MHELHELKAKLMRELKEYGKTDDMSAGSLEVIDKLTHTIKNLCKIIDSTEGEYSEDGSYRGSYYRGSYRGSYDDGSSYRRGRRDSMGRYTSRYSAADDMSDKLQELMDMATDDQTRNDIQRLMDKVSHM